MRERNITNASYKKPHSFNWLTSAKFESSRPLALIYSLCSSASDWLFSWQLDRRLELSLYLALGAGKTERRDQAVVTDAALDAVHQARLRSHRQQGIRNATHDANALAHVIGCLNKPKPSITFRPYFKRERKIFKSAEFFSQNLSCSNLYPN